MKIKFFQIFLVGLILVITSCSENSTTDPSSELNLNEKFQKALDDGIKKYNGKGISAAVIMPNGDRWSGTAGISNTNIPITSGMLFSVGSITKMFTAATILQLAEEGKLSIDDQINKYLPEYPNIDTTIRIRQLLNHTSGICEILDHPAAVQSLFNDPNKIWTLDEVVRLFTLAPYFPKGTDWHYSNTGYLLLRMIIPKVTSSTISTEYRTRFFTPLGLNNSFVAPDELLGGNVAQPWLDLDNDGDYDELPFMKSFYSMGGGGVFCTAEDLVEWSYELFQSKTVLPESILGEMLNFHTPCPNEPLVYGYGLGVTHFAPELSNNLKVWGHGGDALGYAAGCFYLPDYDVCISIMDNTEEGESMYIINDLLKIIKENIN